MIYWLLEKILILTVYADGTITDSNPSTRISIINPLGEGATIETLLNRIINFLAYEIGPVIAVGFIVYAGFLLITAAGSKEKVDLAKKTLLYTFIGYAILLLAGSFIPVIQDVLLGSPLPPTNNSQ